jgi:hypothetical protein
VEEWTEESAFSVSAALRFVLSIALWAGAVYLWSAASTRLGTIMRGLLEAGLWVQAHGPYAVGVGAAGTSVFLALCAGVIGGVLDVRIARRNWWWVTPLLAFAANTPYSWGTWMQLSAPLPSAVLPVMSVIAMLAGQAIGMQSKLTGSASNNGIERTPSALD